MILIPRLLAKEKWFWYIFSIAASLIFFLYIPRQIANLIADPEVFNPQNREFIRNPAFKGKPHLQGMGKRGGRPIADPYNTVLFLLIFTVGTCISVIQRWLKTEHNRKETENEKLSTELSFLKSQVNPHFFFNTLNNIYSLAVVRSEKTAPAVMKLSSIMRYILTETQRDKVPLRNEVDFIHNFIDLQQVRLTDKVVVNFDPDNAGHLDCKPAVAVNDEGIARFKMLDGADASFLGGGLCRSIASWGEQSGKRVGFLFVVFGSQWADERCWRGGVLGKAGRFGPEARRRGERRCQFRITFFGTMALAAS